MTNTILVTGGSGHLGSSVLHHLLESNAVPPESIIATTRTPDKLAGLAARGVVVRFADFGDAASLETAFAGAQTILIVSTDLLDLADCRRLRQHQTAVAAQCALVQNIWLTPPGTTWPPRLRDTLHAAPDKAARSC